MEDRNTAKILIIDDEDSILESLKILLEIEGYGVYISNSVNAAIKLLETDSFNLIISDIKMPGISGLEFVDFFKQKIWGFNKGQLPIILMTAYSDIKTGINAIKNGVFDYISKPFDNEEFKMTVKKALDYFKLYEELNLIKNIEPLREEIKGNSMPVRNLVEEIARVSLNFNVILITGESGTGKELAARMIFKVYSKDKDIPFVPVNLSAIPENLVESELFGYVKGAFTGADRDKAGLLKSADGGILFLDEIGDMPLSIQIKLLRVLQEKKYRRLGSANEESADIKIIAATNRDLNSLIVSGNFRQDLYYRLNKINIKMPPLREHKEDIPLLSAHFIKKYGALTQIIAPEALSVLMSYDYPGNVRELENIIERACIYCGTDSNLEGNSIIGENCLPDFMLNKKITVDFKRPENTMGKSPVLLQELSEEEAIDAAFEIFDAINRSKTVSLTEFVKIIEKGIALKRIKEDNSKLGAAAGLGISLRSLRYILSRKN